MANTKISHINGSRKVAVSGMKEIYKPALGDGTAKPGDLVGIISTAGANKGKVVRTQLGGGTELETFIGIVDDLPTIAEDTAIPDGIPLNIIVPQSGHKYKVKAEDTGDALSIEGFPMGFSSTAGAMEDIATMGTAGVKANLDIAMVDNDTVAQVVWR